MTGEPRPDHDETPFPTFNYLAHVREQEQACIRQIKEDSLLGDSAQQVNAACGFLFWLQRMINGSVAGSADWSKVSALYLLNRAIDDIRVALETSMAGYPVQALSLLASVFEVEVALKEIGTDVEKGLRWLQEEGQAKRVLGDDVERDDEVRRVQKGFDRMGELFYLGLEAEEGDPEEKVRRVRQRNADRYTRVYRELCGYKHIEPSIQREFGTVRTEQGTEVRPGPHWNARTRATLLASHEMMVNLALHVLMAGAHAHLRGEARSQASRSIRQVRRAGSRC